MGFFPPGEEYTFDINLTLPTHLTATPPRVGALPSLVPSVGYICSVVTPVIFTVYNFLLINSLHTLSTSTQMIRAFNDLHIQAKQSQVPRQFNTAVKNSWSYNLKFVYTGFLIDRLHVKEVLKIMIGISLFT